VGQEKTIIFTSKVDILACTELLYVDVPRLTADIENRTKCAMLPYVFQYYLAPVAVLSFKVELRVTERLIFRENDSLTTNHDRRSHQR
jgi:hypothetical protein